MSSAGEADLKPADTRKKASYIHAASPRFQSYDRLR